MITDISDVEVGELTNPKFVKPVRISYKQEGLKKTWEAVKAHDSVAVLLYHKEKNSYLLVKQFRPPVFLNHGIKFTYEMCAGIVDKDKDLAQIAKEEILEECGYDVPLGDIKKLTSYYANVGVAGAKQHLFFAHINESQRVGEGGGIENERIELYFLPKNEVDTFLLDDSKAKTPGLMFGLMFVENIL
jgi:UDP-sugar diphosphatase